MSSLAGTWQAYRQDLIYSRVYKAIGGKHTASLWMGNHISVFHYKTSSLTLWWFRHFTTVAKEWQVHSHHARSNLCAFAAAIPST